MECGGGEVTVHSLCVFLFCFFFARCFPVKGCVRVGGMCPFFFGAFVVVSVCGGGFFCAFVVWCVCRGGGGGVGVAVCTFCVSSLFFCVVLFPCVRFFGGKPLTLNLKP